MNPKGPPPGVRFQKGKSGNPGGRSKEDFRIRDLARERCPEALDVLREIYLDKDAPRTVRIDAAVAMLDRGLGKPVQAIVGDDEHDPIRFADVTDEQRAKALVALLAKAKLPA